jgi:2-oxoglutarate dehydrogenase E2 component (dihydrolipoamide succinyltransferase)
MLAEHHLDPATIAGTGRGGRITKGDVQARLEAAPAVESPAAPVESQAAAAPAQPAASAAPTPIRPVAVPTPIRPAAPAAPAGRGERPMPMSRIRKRIAERLVGAQHTAAILTTFNEIDMSAVMELRARHKERFEKKHGIGLGFMSLFSVACIAALKEVPTVNAEIRGDDVATRLRPPGIAVGTERGSWCPSCATPTSVDRRARARDRADGGSRVREAPARRPRRRRSRSPTAASRLAARPRS